MTTPMVASLSSTTALNRAVDIIGGRDGSITFIGNKGPDPASHVDFECKNYSSVMSAKKP